MTLNILFVCTWNVQRSKTAEDVFNKLIEGKKGFSVDSAGTAAKPSMGGKQLTRELMEWADKVYIMEDLHNDYIQKNFSEFSQKVVSLDIPDIYYRGDHDLVMRLKDKLTKILDDLQRS